MLTKGIIQSIDLLGNSCIVRLPLFETAGTKEAFTATAYFACQPGVYNGYKTNDVVVVGFGSGGYGDAIVIGKLYLGASAEKTSAGGTVHCVDLAVSGSASLPGYTALDFGDSDSGVISTTTPLTAYSTIKDLASAVSQNEYSINALQESAQSASSFSTDDKTIGYWIDNKELKQRTISTSTAITVLNDVTSTICWLDTGKSFIVNPNTKATKPIGAYYIEPLNTSSIQIILPKLQVETSTIIYFEDAEWWRADNAVPTIYLWNSSNGNVETVWPGEYMHKISGTNYWWYEVDVFKYDMAIFARRTSSGGDGNAQTEDIDLSDRFKIFGSNTYTIADTSAVWTSTGNKVVGEWEVYPNDPPEEFEADYENTGEQAYLTLNYIR